MALKPQLFGNRFNGVRLPECRAPRWAQSPENKPSVVHSPENESSVVQSPENKSSVVQLLENVGLQSADGKRVRLAIATVLTKRFASDFVRVCLAVVVRVCLAVVCG
jgi:hypothetical protein